MTNKRKAWLICLAVELLLWPVSVVVVVLYALTLALYYVGDTISKELDFHDEWFCRRRTLGRWIKLDRERGENTTVAQAKERDRKLFIS